MTVAPHHHFNNISGFESLRLCECVYISVLASCVGRVEWGSWAHTASSGSLGSPALSPSSFLDSTSGDKAAEELIWMNTGSLSNDETLACKWWAGTWLGMKCNWLLQDWRRIWFGFSDSSLASYSLWCDGWCLAEGLRCCGHRLNIFSPVTS